MSTVTTAPSVSLDSVRAANPGWFSPSAMRWFSSRVGSTGFLDRNGAIYFVSSERDIYGDNVRRYSVRVWKGEGYGIDTVGVFCGYASRNGAMRAARRIASA